MNEFCPQITSVKILVFIDAIVCSRLFSYHGGVWRFVFSLSNIRWVEKRWESGSHWRVSRQENLSLINFNPTRISRNAACKTSSKVTRKKGRKREKTQKWKKRWDVPRCSNSKTSKNDYWYFYYLFDDCVEEMILKDMHWILLYFCLHWLYTDVSFIFRAWNRDLSKNYALSLEASVEYLTLVQRLCLFESIRPAEEVCTK